MTSYTRPNPLVQRQNADKLYNSLTKERYRRETSTRQDDLDQVFGLDRSGISAAIGVALETSRIDRLTGYGWEE